MPHDKELVERVAADLREQAGVFADEPLGPWEDASDDAQDGWRHLARYALDLASRASIISTIVAADPAWKDRVATTAFASECVRRAVENT